MKNGEDTQVIEGLTKLVRKQRNELEALLNDKTLPPTKRMWIKRRLEALASTAQEELEAHPATAKPKE